MQTSTESVEKISIGGLLEPIRVRLWSACVLQAISALAGVVPFIAVAELGKVLLASSAIDQSQVWWIAAGAVAALAVRFLCLMAAGALTHLADLDLQLQLRCNMAKHLASVPLGWFDERSAGAIKKALQDDVAALHHLVGHAYTNRVTAVVAPVAILAYLFWVDWCLALAAITPLVLGMALYSIQYRGYGEKIVAYNRALSAVNSAAIEFAQGIAVIKTFGQSGKAYRRFIERTKAFVDFFWHWMRGLLSISAAAEIILSPLFSMLSVLLVGLLLVGFGILPAVDILPAIILAPALSAPILSLSYAQNDMMLAKEAASHIGEILATASLAEPTKPQTPRDYRVLYEDVSFSYDGHTEVLKNIDLLLEPGTVTALVGPSGSGKSTLAQLLPRFWDVSGGRISIGGVAIGDMAPQSLYRSVSFVFQQVQLLRGTIAENIALGQAGVSQKEIEAVAKAAHIHERILSLPHGYESVAGEDAHLSGGEAQRVSIARALLANAPILVLDEATAFADPESEAAIQDALSVLARGRTLLVIAHRLTTIAAADQICVMDEGCIVERGRHQGLLDQHGLYAQLWAASEAGLIAAQGTSS